MWRREASTNLEAYKGWNPSLFGQGSRLCNVLQIRDIWLIHSLEIFSHTWEFSFLIHLITIGNRKSPQKYGLSGI